MSSFSNSRLFLAFSVRHRGIFFLTVFFPFSTSQLLDVLADRKSVGIIEGDRLVNGRTFGKEFQRGCGVSSLPQEAIITVLKMTG